MSCSLCFIVGQFRLQCRDFGIRPHVVEREQHLSGLDVVAVLHKDGLDDPAFLMHYCLAFAIVTHDTFCDDCA
jgi:hypothetical protein